MKCFMCYSNFQTIVALTAHFKVFHSLFADSVFDCIEDNCHQSFSNINTFKKHLKRKHTSNPETDLSVKHSKPSCPPSNNFDEEISNDLIKARDTNTLFTFDSAKNLAQIRDSIMVLNNTLYSSIHFSNKDVQVIQANIKNIVVSPIEEYLSNLIKYENDNGSDFVSDNIRQLHTTLKCLMKSKSADSTFKSLLQSNNFESEVQKFSVHSDISVEYKNGEPQYVQSVKTGSLLPIKYNFKTTFEANDLLDDYLLKNIDTISGQEHIFSFLEGQLWKDLLKICKDIICIPYFLYFDDFEVSNPLGTHTEQICGIYYCFPGFENISKLSNIFVAGFMKSSEMKKYGNSASLKFLIQQLNELAVEGISITTTTCTRQVHFILGLVLGDNLGVNYVCDFE